MSTFVVNTTADSGAGSLRASIIQANGDPGSIITFDTSLANLTITLASALPAITTDMTIDASTTDVDANVITQNITISGASASRVFFVSSGSVDLRFFTIANGHAAGDPGTDGGGGGMGAGAAIFVASGDTIVSNVNFTSDAALGGTGGSFATTGLGAGGNGPDGTGSGTTGGGAGGFGGGGGGSVTTGGSGGFGGGGGGGIVAGGTGGVGGGQGGTSATAGGGGGAGLGGAIFVSDGASLTLDGNTFSSDTVTAGAGGTTGGTAGAAAGSDLFLVSTGTYVFSPDSFHTITFNGGIADDSAASLTGGTYTTGSGAGAAVLIAGAGTVVYNGINSYAGQTTVANGVLTVNGTLSNSTTLVENTGTLDGTGTVGTVSMIDGTLAPGSVGSVGTLHTGNLSLSGGTLAIDLNGAGAGQFDVLQVTGSVDLSGVTLGGTLGFTPTAGQTFDIIHSSSPVTGTFAGVPEGGDVGIGGHAFQVTYAGGGGGDDVVLTALANSPPVISGGDPVVKFRPSDVNPGPQILDGDINFNDIEGNFNNGTLTVAGLLAEDTISILSTGFDPGQFFLNGNQVLFEGNNIGTFSGGNGSTFSVTFNSSATSHAVGALIDNLTYADSATNPTAQRTLTITAMDSDAASSGPHSILVEINQPPVLGGIPGSATSQGTPVVLAPAAAVSDPDDTNLASATVQIIAGSFAGDGDLLTAKTSGTSITATFDSASETLMLSGSDTLAHYQQVLDSVTYQSTSSNPANSGANPTRSIDWSVSDGLANSNHASETLTLAAVALHGTPGNDTFTALPGNERIDGLGGVDTINFNFKLTDATVSFVANQVIVDGPNASSHTVLTGFDIYKFTDGTVTESTSDPLVDNLFYYSHYHDVWNAHVDASQHYHTIGWHEGLDPDAFFSTSTYLSKNTDVKAAGVDPLLHFDQSGWKEGRDPSIAFDTNAYLNANPDVKAAHVDPLAQFLANGEAEGRQPIAPTALFASNGFDFVYYLQHNPDVAAAHVDPFQHYETVGWKEGRNPNALFDVNGYLNAYADVKAAGVNPLDQYHQNGWMEGRDPSVNFDTKNYLSHYPDVAAAHVDPLFHYLAFGIHEGRSAFADGNF